jgi:hypothetical protein
MDIFKELHEALDAFAENIAKEIAEKRFYEMGEVKAIAKTRLWSALFECLQLQVTEKEKERRKLVEEYAKAKGDRIVLGAKIAKVNSEKADANRLMHNMRDYNHFEQLKKYLNAKYGNEVWKDFRDNFLNKDENRLKPFYPNASTNQVNPFLKQ